MIVKYRVSSQAGEQQTGIIFFACFHNKRCCQLNIFFVQVAEWFIEQKKAEWLRKPAKNGNALLLSQ